MAKQKKKPNAIGSKFQKRFWNGEWVNVRRVKGLYKIRKINKKVAGRKKGYNLKT